MEINLTVIIKSKSEYREELKSFLVDLSRDSKNEEACLQYDLHQNTDNENLFILHEVWKNDEGLDFHNKQSYLLEFIKKANLFLEEKPTIYRTSRIA